MTVGETRHVVARWSESPFTSYDRRGNVIEHRVVLAHYDDVGTDVVHEVRSSDDRSVSDEWTELESYEVRDQGVRHYPPREGQPEVLRE